MGHVADTALEHERALDDLVARVMNTRSRIAALEAEQASLLVEASEFVRARSAERATASRSERNDIALREVTAELGAAMRLSDRSVEARMSSAFSLARSFPATLRRLEAGEIDAAHAAVIVDAGVGLTDAARTEYERITLEAAAHETPHRLRAIARVVAARLDPDMLDELQRRGRSGRHVRVIDLEDGMARLLADLPATLAHAIHDRLTQMAHEVRREAAHEVRRPEAPAAADCRADSAANRPAQTAANGPASGAVDSADPGSTAVVVQQADMSDPRSLDQLRADILADVLLTSAPSGHGDADALGAIRAHVQVTVPVLTLAGVGNQPALLAGSGPIDIDTARRLAAEAPGWDRVMTHPHSGTPLAVDRYRPSAELMRFLRVRDERCRFPGCVQRP